MKHNLIPKEISWLYFNERVLQEAADKNNSLRERINFLGIYSNNLDEFYRVRVASLRRLAPLGKKSEEILGYNSQIVLKELHTITVSQQKFFAGTYEEILDELEKNNIKFVTETKLSETQKDFLGKYFTTNVRPLLMPIMINQVKSMPKLQDNMVYLAVCIISENKSHNQHAIIEIPTDVLPRFVEIPKENGFRCIMFLDDIVRFGLREIFHLFDIKDISAYTIKITKDAELDINDDVSESYVDKLSQSIRKRKEGEAVRFIYDKNMPQGFLKLFLKKLNIRKTDNIIPGGRYHNFKDFLRFPDLDLPEYSRIVPSPVPCHQIKAGESIFSAVRKKDLFFYFPYHSFDHFIDLLRDASIDPHVKSIKCTLYRLAKHSSVIDALVNAARNGKDVSVVMELQARFDEEANLNWSNLLHEEGVKVIYGVPGLKVHAKICLIERIENNKKILYTCIGTGNFNENTSKVYTDVMLMTSNTKITREVEKVFVFLNKNYQIDNFNHIILSPFSNRKKVASFIQNEIENKKKGLPAFIKLKLNNLVDAEIIELLYKASKAGVKIYLSIRGMNSLMPDKYPNIEAYGLVDRFLEHSRIIIFANGGNDRVFISSSDLMTRNLDRRVEVVCPIYDKEIKNIIKNIFEIHFKDNVKARVLDNALSNKYRDAGKEKPFRSQEEVYKYLLEVSDGLRD
jgi:polyphosphate kinase